MEFAICRKPLLFSGAIGPEDREFAGSPLEGTGFETSVPLAREQIGCLASRTVVIGEKSVNLMGTRPLLSLAEVGGDLGNRGDHRDSH